MLALTVPALGADADKTAAMAHYEAGTRLYDIKEFAKALDEYKAAYLAKPDPAFLFNIGQCYRKLGKRVEALDFYQEYLKKAPPDDPNRPSVEARIQDLDSGDVFDGDAPPKPVTRQVLPPPPLQPTPAGVPSPEPPPPSSVPPTAQVPSVPDSQIETESGTTVQPAPLMPVVVTPQPAPPVLAGVVLTTAEPPQQVSAGTSFYKTWWFWTGVGAAVVAGTVTAVLLSESGNGGVTASTALGTQGVFQ